MPLNNAQKLEIIRKYVPEIINVDDAVWYMDENKEPKYTYKGYRLGCEKLLALIHFDDPLNSLVNDKAFDELADDERKWHQIGIEQLEFFSTAVLVRGKEYIFDEDFSFSKCINYCFFSKEYMTNPLDPESKPLSGLKNLLCEFSRDSLLKKEIINDRNSAFETEFSNDKKQRNLELQLAPKCYIQNEEGACIQASVLWDRVMRPGDTYIVTKGFDGCLFIFTEPDFERFTETLQSMSDKNSYKGMIERFFLASSSMVEITPDYQMRLPQSLIDFARIRTEAVIEGKGDFARLWNRLGWEAVHFVGIDDVLRRLKIQRGNDALQKRAEEVIGKYVQMVSIISRDFLRELKRQMIDEIANLYNVSITYSFKEEMINKAYIADSSVIKNEPIELELMGRDFIERITSLSF